MTDRAIPLDALRGRSSTLWRDRFIQVVFHRGAEVTVADAQETLALGRELHARDPVPTLVDLRFCRALSAAARAHLAGENGVRLAQAVAIVVGSPLSRAIGNFYLGVNRPSKPTRLFSTFDAAEQWLEAYLPTTGLERVA